MERTKNTVTKEQIFEFAEKWGYKTRYDEDTRTIHLSRIHPRRKTFYYVEAVIEKIHKKFGKTSFKIK